MRRADHDAVDRATRHLGVTGQQRERGDNAAGHIGGGRRLDRLHHPAVFKQHRIGVGAADIDPYAAHRSLTR
jgi:hypothetical protein